VKPARSPYLLLWLLPLLVARLLLPPGVMPGSNLQGAALVLCSMHHDAAGRAGHQAPVQGDSHGEKVCPFAAAAAAAPVSTAPAVAVRVAKAAIVAMGTVAQRRADAGPPRSQTSRGPPILS